MISTVSNKNLQGNKSMSKSIINIFDLFCNLLFLYCFIYVLESSQLSNEFPILSSFLIIVQGSLFIIGLISILQKKFNVKKLIFISLVLMVFLISSYLSRTQTFLITIFFSIVAKDEDKDKAIFSLINGILFACALVVFLYVFDLIPESVYSYHRDGELRYSLGFNQPVVLPGYYLGVAIGYLYLNRNKITSLKIVLLLLPSIVIAEFTDARASFYSLVIASILIVLTEKLLKDRKLKSQIFYYFALLSYFIGIVISIFMAEFYGSFSILNRINDISTGRVWWFSRYWNMYSPTIFGQNILRVGSVTARDTGESMMILDNAHLSMILENGILVFILVTIMIYFLLKRLKEKEDYISLIIWTVIFFNFVTGNNFLTFWRNPLLFQFSILLVPRNVRIKNKTSTQTLRRRI